MKRGRPILRSEVQKLILEELRKVEVPVTINALCKLIRKSRGRRISWNTVEKYLSELVNMGVVTPISLPHSKVEGKKGLTVYTIKR